MGAVNRNEAMALFEDVHSIQLEHAYYALTVMPRYSRWRIALREKLTPLLLDEAMACQTMTCIDVRLSRNGKQLELADVQSEQAIEDWEKRYHDEVPWAFDMPPLGGDDGAVRN